jgi:hypothetical protein
LPDSNLAGAAKILAPIARAARPKARQLYQERRAGQVPFAGGMDFLDKIFDEILDRLRGGITDEGWWKRVCSNVGHAIVAPEFFHIHSVREWLAAEQVRSDLEALARARLLEVAARAMISNTASRRPDQADLAPRQNEDET